MEDGPIFRTSSPQIPTVDRDEMKRLTPGYEIVETEVRMPSTDARW